MCFVSKKKTIVGTIELADIDKQVFTNCYDVQ